MMSRALVCAVLAAACSRSARKDVSPAIAAEAPEAAAREAGLQDSPALTSAEMTEHVLSRVSFGANQEGRARVQSLGIAAWLEEQLHPGEIDDGALDQRLVSLSAL